MKRILILGAGTGGALCANLLSHRLDLKQWSITVIDREQRHVYQPGLLFLPLALYGYTKAEDLVRPIASPLPRAAGNRARSCRYKASASAATMQQRLSSAGNSSPRTGTAIR